MKTIDRLEKILLRCDGMINRRFIEGERDIVKKNAALAEANAQGTASPVDDPAQATASPVDLPASHDKTPISVLALTLSRSHIDRLEKLEKEGFSEGQPACFSIGDDVADDAVMVVAGRVGDLVSLAKLLDCWRFERFSHIYLLDAPSGPDVLRANALAVCERGNLRAAAQLMGWPSEKDPLALAEILTEGIAGRRVHLFADQHTPGWESIVGDANWRVKGPES